jgi:O-antigen/teichoic acid export membrane protein
MTEPSLRRNVAWAFIGSLSLSLSQWGMLIAVAKLGGASTAGDWNLALAITGPVFVFCQLKLRQLQATDARREHPWGVYAAVRVLGMSAALAFCAALAFFMYRDATALVILAVAVAKAFEGGSDVVYGQLQRQEMMSRIARSQLGRGVLSLVVSAGVFAATRSVVGMAVGMAAVYAACLTWDVARLRSALGGDPLAPCWDRAAVARVIRVAAPLGLMSAIGSLQLNVPRYFIEAHAGRAELGVFSSLAQLLLLGALVVAAIASAAVPRLARHAADRRWAEFHRLLRTLIVCGIGLGLLAILLSAVAGRFALTWLYSAEFAAHDDVLVWLAGSSALLWSYAFLGTALDALRSFRVQPWIFGLSTAVIAIASSLLVPTHGLLGAAWALLIGFGVECLLFVVAVTAQLRHLKKVSSS